MDPVLDDDGIVHEVLFALLGYPGQFVTFTQHDSFVLSPSAKAAISCSTADLITEVLRAASDYVLLDRFVSDVRLRNSASAVAEPFEDGDDHAAGLYRSALAEGIDCFLEEYRELVGQLEETLEGGLLPLVGGYNHD